MWMRTLDSSFITRSVSLAVTRRPSSTTVTSRLAGRALMRSRMTSGSQPESTHAWVSRSGLSAYRRSSSSGISCSEMVSILNSMLCSSFSSLRKTVIFWPTFSSISRDSPVRGFVPCTQVTPDRPYRISPPVDPVTTYEVFRQSV